MRTNKACTPRFSNSSYSSRTRILNIPTSTLSTTLSLRLKTSRPFRGLLSNTLSFNARIKSFTTVFNNLKTILLSLMTKSQT